MGAVTVIQVKDACGLDWSGNSRGGEEILDSRYICKVECTGFIDGLVMGRGNKDDSRFFGLSDWKDGIALNRKKDGGAGLGRKFGNSVLDVWNFTCSLDI